MTPDDAASATHQADRARGAGLTAEELHAEQTSELPDREAMTVLSIGGIEGGLPTPGFLDGVLDAEGSAEGIVGAPTVEGPPEADPVSMVIDPPVIEPPINAVPTDITEDPGSVTVPEPFTTDGTTGFPDLPTSPPHNGSTLA